MNIKLWESVKMMTRREIKHIEKKLEKCIECKKETARYAGNKLCEKCWREFLKERL